MTAERVRVLLADPRFKELVLLVGIPGAGKSSWLREHADPSAIYVDATFCSRKTRLPFIEIASSLGKPIKAVLLHTPFEECLRRNALRTPDRQVPEIKMQSFHQDLLSEPPSMQEGFKEVIHVGLTSSRSPVSLRFVDPPLDPSWSRGASPRSEGQSIVLPERGDASWVSEPGKPGWQGTPPDQPSPFGETTELELGRIRLLISRSGDVVLGTSLRSAGGVPQPDPLLTPPLYLRLPGQPEGHKERKKGDGGKPKVDRL